LKERTKAKKEEPRRKLLIELLEDPKHTQHWCLLDMLMAVIGADEETTKRLLIEIGARGSQDINRNWGLIKYHPIGETRDTQSSKVA
jgi:hypothetical protein